MAVDQFLLIDGLKGESQDASHKDQIELLAWSWGMSQGGTLHSGTGAGSGKVSVQDISVTKWIDKSSPNLMMACCTGKHYKEASIIVRKAGEKPLEYVKIIMTDVIVTNVSVGGSSGEERLTENVSLNFASFEVEYTPQKADGSGDATVLAKFDIAKNEAK